MILIRNLKYSLRRHFENEKLIKERYDKRAHLKQKSRHNKQATRKTRQQYTDATNTNWVWTMSCRNVISLGFDNIRAKPLFFYLTVQIRNDGRTFTILKRVTTVLISLATWTQHEVQFLRIRNQRELIRPWNYMSLWWYRSSRCCWLRFTTRFPFLNSFRLSHIKKVYEKMVEI